jgi:hypothetical protein
MFKALTTFALVAGALGTYPAMAATETFLFTGDCSDCLGGNGRVVAQLSLQDYKYGDPISRVNFVSFNYSGSNRYSSFTIDGKDDYGVAGEMAGTGSSATFFSVNDAQHMFFSFGTGTWGSAASGSKTSDFGYSHSYTLAGAPVSAAPEPTMWALMIMGVGMAGAALRRQQKGAMRVHHAV